MPPFSKHRDQVVNIFYSEKSTLFLLILEPSPSETASTQLCKVERKEQYRFTIAQYIHLVDIHSHYTFLYSHIEFDKTESTRNMVKGYIFETTKQSNISNGVKPSLTTYRSCKKNKVSVWHKMKLLKMLVATWATLLKSKDSGGLNETSPIHSSIWTLSQLVALVGVKEPLGSVSLMEEACHWGMPGRVHSLAPLLVSLPLFTVCAWRCELSALSLVTPAMPPPPWWALIPYKPNKHFIL